jgi:hypothetical protein
MIATIAVINGCASNENYHTILEDCIYIKAGDCSQAAIQHYHDDTDLEYHLGFVEFDDQGLLRDRKQLKEVLEHFKSIAETQDVLLVSFVHGWHHSASPDDTDVKDFRKLLNRLAKAEAADSHNDGHAVRTVLGMYVGWRGDSITIPVFNDLTFWERKNTAHDVGSGGVAEVFLKLEEIVNIRAGKAGESTDKHNSRLVILGHSFGGAIVATALHQILTDRYIDSRTGKTTQGDANGVGDLVVLLNPAFEAMRFASIYDISQQDCRQYPPSQLPKLAILTSEADWATKYVFPAGRFFSTLFETHDTLERHYCNKNGEQVIMPLDEGDADRNTVGHFEPFRTHSLKPLSQSKKRSVDFSYQSLQQSWTKQKPGSGLIFESLELKHLDRTHPLNPYLNIYVDESIIGNHNAIWGKNVSSFIRDFIMISTMQPKTSD